MIKYLKKLWNWCGSMWYYSIKEDSIKEVKHTSTDLPILTLKPKPLHCKLHTRFKKSCSNCLTAVGVK